MKKSANRIGCLLLALLLLGGMFPVRASSANIATVMQVYQVPGSERNLLNLSFRLTTPNNIPVISAEGLAFSLNGVNVPYQAYRGQGVAGHVMVVDLSEYYSTRLDMKVVSALAGSMLNGIPSGERVMIIAVSGNGTQTYTNADGSWMTTSQAMRMVESFGQTKGQKGSNVYAAIEEAIKIAMNVSHGDDKTPAFISSVLVVTGGLITGGDSYKESIKQRLASRKLSLVVSWPWRKAYLSKTDNKHTVDVTTGMREMENLINSVGGTLFTAVNEDDAPQRIKLDDLSRLQDVTTERLKGAHYFLLDASSLIGAVQYQRNDTLDLMITGSASGQFIGIPFDSTGIERPTPTPEPPTPTPTMTVPPTPTPIPYVVNLGDSHKEARQILIRLKELYYLTVDTKDVFNEDARSALYKLLDRNNLPDAEGVTQEAYNFIMYGEPTPYPTATPTPPGPTPTPPPMELEYGLTDKQMGMERGGYIMQMQEALYRLNCFQFYGNTYTPGEFGESTAQAVALYSEAYGIKNTKPSGVSLELLLSILDSGDKPPVSPSPEPTATPSPTPVPVPSLAKGETDQNNPQKWIKQLQDKLRALGYFSILPGDQKFTPGTLDEVTLAAVAAYAAKEGISGSFADGISANVLEGILEIDPGVYGTVAPTATPTPPGIIESVRERLTETVAIADFEIPIWVIVLVSAVLLLGIIVVMALLRAGRKKDVSSISQVVSRGELGESDRKSDAMGTGMEERTVADGPAFTPAPQQPHFEDSDVTIAGGIGVPATIVIEFAGSTRTEHPIIGDSLTIGRQMTNLMLDNADKGVSRQHAKLYSRNGNVYIQDLGSVNGTFVDGVQVPSSGAAQSRGDVTVPMDIFNAAQADFALTNGAKVRIGNHTLTITW